MNCRNPVPTASTFTDERTGKKLSQSELETAVTSYLEQSWFRLVAADCEECASNERNEGHDNAEARR
jgi:hypothetical protein